MTRRQRVRRAVAVGVWAVSWTLALASLAILWAAGLPSDPLPGVFLSQAPLEMRARFDEIGVTVALVYGPVSALILARRPHPVGVIIAIHAVGSGVAAFGVQYGLLGAHVPDLPLWGLVAFSAGWGFVPGTFMTAALPILVTRRRVPRWQRAIVWCCAVIALTAFFVSLTQQSVPTPVNPLAIDDAAYQAALPAVYTVLSFAAVAISVLSSVILIVRWVRAREAARVGIAWLTVGHVFLTMSYLALVLPAGLDLPPWIVDFGLVAPVLGQILYPAAILVVILGQRLWGVELVVSRILLWSLLSISGVVLYLGVVAVVPATLSGLGGLSLIVPVVVAVAVLPLRSWLQRRIDRLIYGDGADAAQLLARLGDRIGELPPGPEGIAELAETLRRVLRLGWVEIRATGLHAEAGVRTQVATTEVPLPSTGQGAAAEHGQLTAQPVGGQRLDRRTLTVLGDVAGLVATVVRLAEAYLILDAARSALVARRADERRAIRRELHDGLGPALAGIGFGLAAVENLAVLHPERARALLAELAGDLHRRARDVRSLAGEVAGPQFDADELPDALGRLARRFDSDVLRVRVDVDDVGELGAGTADALYFIAAEALTNTARHAGATTAAIRVTVSADAVQLDIVDDGDGMPEGARAGIGLASMRERAAVHGGETVITSGSHGTTVRALLPRTRSLEDARP